MNLPDAIFPSDNDIEIPTLRLDMQAELCDIPFVCWGEQRRTFKMNGAGTLHFYTDDYRFKTIYDHPESIADMQPRNIVEPNYSLFMETPIAFGMQAVYKKRFIARSLQQVGIRIIVDLNVASKFYKLNMLGVPMGWRAFATRGYSNRLDYLHFEHKLATDWAGTDDILFVVYGGGKICKDFCKEKGAIYVEQLVNVKNTHKPEDLIRIGQTIACSDDPKTLITASVRQLQITDFSQNLIENEHK